MYTVADRLSPNVLLLSQFPSSSPTSMQNNALVQAGGGKNKPELSARCPGAGDDEHHSHNDDDEQGHHCHGDYEQGQPSHGSGSGLSVG